MKKSIRRFCLPLSLLTAFILWTAALLHADVQAVGPGGSCVGLAGMNVPFHRLTGVNMALYVLTDWLGLIPVGVCAGFAALGLAQWIRRKGLTKVDRSILILGGFYLAVIGCYLFFERFVVNYRPVLISGALEASYPSSTTLLTMCVIPTAVMQLRSRLARCRLRGSLTALLTAFLAFMVVGRLLSGVHWLSDVIGGGLLSAALVTLYRAAVLTWPDL